MQTFDLLGLREQFNSQKIMLCFNGPISRSLIEEIGNALRNYLAADHAHPSAAMDVFAIYIELTQNIRHYARLKSWSEQDSGAIVVVSRNDDGQYVISAGNLIEPADGLALVQRLDELALMDKAALKACYKEQLRKPRDESNSSGAGLGLIDVARKSSAPVRAFLQEADAGRAFVCISAVV